MNAQTFHSAYIQFGSNQGLREEQIRQANLLLEQRAGSLCSMSSIYETEAWGVKDQPKFLNRVVELRTSHSAEILLGIILEIEREMGRVRNEKWMERKIDIDILFFDDAVIEIPGLSVPHPRLHLRRFSLVPLAEIVPGLLHPVLKKTVCTLLRECPDPLSVVQLNSAVSEL